MPVELEIEMLQSTPNLGVMGGLALEDGYLYAVISGAF